FIVSSSLCVFSILQNLLVFKFWIGPILTQCQLLLYFHCVDQIPISGTLPLVSATRTDNPISYNRTFHNLCSPSFVFTTFTTGKSANAEVGVWRMAVVML